MTKCCRCRAHAHCSARLHSRGQQPPDSHSELATPPFKQAAAVALKIELQPIRVLRYVQMRPDFRAEAS